jgi:hypothetical protein
VALPAREYYALKYISLGKQRTQSEALRYPGKNWIPARTHDSIKHITNRWLGRDDEIRNAPLRACPATGFGRDKSLRYIDHLNFFSSLNNEKIPKQATFYVLSRCRQG